MNCQKPYSGGKVTLSAQYSQKIVNKATYRSGYGTRHGAIFCATSQQNPVSVEEQMQRDMSISCSQTSIPWDDLDFNDKYIGEAGGAVYKGTPTFPCPPPLKRLAMDRAYSKVQKPSEIVTGESIYLENCAIMGATTTIMSNTALPVRNALRMQKGASKLCMPKVPVNIFLHAVASTVRSNSYFVPPHRKGSFYVRPLLIGTGSRLGLGPAPSYTFMVFGGAVGSYFDGGQMKPLNIKIEDSIHRSVPGGMGGVKASGNYGAVLKACKEAQYQEFDDVIFLDAQHDKYLEEMSSSNIFAVYHDKKIIKTPPTNGNILHGVTRDSIIQLATQMGYQVEYELSLEQAKQADEMFATGTAVVVSQIGSITHKNKRISFNSTNANEKSVAMQLHDKLKNIQLMDEEDKLNWLVDIESI